MTLLTCAPVSGAPRATERRVQASSTTASTRIATIATNVSGAFCHVSTAKKPSTIAVTAIASTTSAGLLRVSARRRQPASADQEEDHQRDGAADGGDRREVDEVRDEQHEPGVISSPACSPRRDFAPKKAGKSRSCASIEVRLPEA